MHSQSGKHVCDEVLVALDDPRALDLSGMPMPEFRVCVQAWANSFDAKYRTVAFVLGNAVDRRTCVAHYTQDTLHRKMQEMLDRQGNGDVAMSPSTMRGRLREMRSHGVIDAVQPRKVVTNRAGVQHFQALPNETWVDFTSVIRNGECVPHDFLSPLSEVAPYSETGINSDTPADAAGDGIPFQSSFNRSSKECLPAEGTPLATRGATPRRPQVVNAEMQVQSAGDLAPDWWREALQNCYRYLAETYETPINGHTLEMKFLPLLNYVEDEEDLLEYFWGFMEARCKNMRPGDEVRYILGTFPAWVEENFWTVEERNAPEVQARNLFDLATQLDVLSLVGTAFRCTKPDGTKVGMTEPEWLEVLRAPEKADLMRAMIAAASAERF